MYNLISSRELTLPDVFDQTLWVNYIIDDMLQKAWSFYLCNVF